MSSNRSLRVRPRPHVDLPLARLAAQRRPRHRPPAESPGELVAAHRQHPALVEREPEDDPVRGEAEIIDRVLDPRPGRMDRGIHSRAIGPRLADRDPRRAVRTVEPDEGERPSERMKLGHAEGEAQLAPGLKRDDGALGTGGAQGAAIAARRDLRHVGRPRTNRRRQRHHAAQHRTHTVPLAAHDGIPQGSRATPAHRVAPSARK